VLTEAQRLLSPPPSNNPWETPVFWQKVGELAAPGIADAVVRRANDAAMGKGDLLRIVNHNIAGMMEINRIGAAMGNGLANSDSFRMPYGQSVVNNHMTAPVTQQASPAPAKSGLLKGLAATALLATGAGALAGGGYGVYSLVDSLKGQVTKPAEVKPINLDMKVSFDPDQGGLQVKPVEPPK
jgi:hypothetical protein